MKTRIYTLLAALLLTVASANAEDKTATTISVEDIIPIATGGDGLVYVTLKPEITTVATLTVSNSDNSYNQSFYVAIADGDGHCIVPNLAAGTYSCTASFAGNALYAASTSEAKTLTVSNIPTALAITLKDEAIYVGDWTRYMLELQDPNRIVNGEPATISINTLVTVSINGENRIVGIVNGHRSSSKKDEPTALCDFPAGTYKLKATFAGIGPYDGCTSNEVTLTVNKIATSISVSDISPIDAGDDAVVTVTMTPTEENAPPIDGIAQLTVGENSYNVAIANGVGSCVVPNLAAGTYDVTASFATDEKYIGSTSTSKQLVVNEKSGADAASPLPKNAVATVTMSPASTNTIVQLTVGSNTYHVPVINGTGTYVLPQMECGTYDVQATHVGNPTYYGGETFYTVSQSAVRSLMALANVVLADDADNNPTLSTLTYSPAYVTLSGRTLYKDGAWNTLCLPFDVSIKSGTLSGDDVVAMTLNSSSNLNDGTLTLNFDAVATTGEQTGVIPAGTPFIIKWGNKEDTGLANLVDPVFSGVTIDKDASTEVHFTGGSFVGTYAPREYSERNTSILFLGANNTLYYPQPADADHPVTIGAFRAYFDLGSHQARAFVLNFGDGEQTGITTTNYTNFTNDGDAWYTLDGVKLDKAPTRKGLYIRNGRKVVIK